MAVDIDKDTMAIILWKIKTNLEETGHPMHHKVGDGSGTIVDTDVTGTIVDTDVTLEQMIKKLNPLPTVPVNRTRYGFDLYSDEGGR